MKMRISGLVLAGIAVLSLTLSSFAATESVRPAQEQPAAETPATQSPAVEVPVVETPVVPDSDLYLNGEPLTELVYRVDNNICYVTVASFVAAIDRNAVVEEEGGMVAVTASCVKEVADVDHDVRDAAKAAQADLVEETLTLTAQAGEYYLVANGRYLYAPDCIKLIDGCVAAPIRVLAKVFNLNVEYHQGTGKLRLSDIEGTGAYLEPGASYYDENDLYWLSRIIFSESGNQSLNGRIAVGNVVMNRVNDPDFPDNIYDVLFQRNQFSPAMSGSIYRDPSKGSVIAAKLVLDGANVVGDALFFNRAGMNTFASRNRPYVATIGAHAFYG